MNSYHQAFEEHKKIQWFEELSLEDLPRVGEKNASLGVLYEELMPQGINVPNGFAITTEVYRDFMNQNNTAPELGVVLGKLDTRRFSNLKETGARARAIILMHQLPYPCQIAILSAYQMLLDSEGEDISLAVRSSATAAGAPHACFVGQQENFLNVKGEDLFLKACLHCYASLYTDRAIRYRVEQGLREEDVAISIGVQGMVRADKACSGIMYTSPSGKEHKNSVAIYSSWGLGRLVVKHKIDPDEFIVYKPNLETSTKSIVSSKIGHKQEKLVYNKKVHHSLGASTQLVKTTPEEQQQLSLTPQEVKTLAKWGILIEQHYQKPMYIEWAKDGLTGKLFVVQARPNCRIS